ncbi:CLUMA_CG012947, isoform A [Clunio marinus]|uniref:CLUMA_CG012947, isoform A n=1 Tax=Clunio marinus TaxID=568069 RepID=A0A1J1IJB6_9DIPT|nr:CLUMA_CG012947, isoform A [Clunio marinus]
MSNHELMSIDDQTLANIMNKRHRSAKSQFKNPPQPKFCIKERTLDGRDLFINVLSYSRIANQLSEFDPIPLYGGMQIRSFGSIKNNVNTQPPHLIFAVMASPEVLKKTGRNCADTPEQMNLVELMCEFVEAMNPGIVLSKKPEILKDRDLAGELKDVWSAVQNFRDKEKAGISDIVVYTEFGPESGSVPFEASEPMMKSLQRNDPCYGKAVKSENNHMNELEQCVESQNCNEKGGDDDEAVEKERENISLPEKSVDESDLNLKIDKMLSLSSKKIESNNQENHHTNESSGKIIKVQNQKNQQHNFFPKFLSSSKEKEAKDKEKDKDKDKDEVEPKTKTKKSLNFFRRNKSSTGSPTHGGCINSISNNQKSDNNTEH